MPLLDHFRPPLRTRRHWQGFHTTWATRIAADLNRRLPEGWHAEPYLEIGIEIDAAVLDDRCEITAPDGEADPWTPPAPTLTIDFPPTTEIAEVRVMRDLDGSTLAGAIEIVSPGNKDRSEAREGFVSKCETYLREGVGLVVIDIVTRLRSNLHAELIRRLDQAHAGRFDAPLYAVAYHPVVRDEEPILRIWHEPLTVGGPLPVMPLPLKQGPLVAIDLPSTYRETCRDLRIRLEADNGTP